MPAPVALLAAAEGGGHGVQGFLLALVATIVATQLLGYAATRIGQPAVLGELVAGVLLGRSVLGVLHPGDPAVAAFAELGVLILLFQIGLHTNLRALLAVGGTAAAVAIAGVILPFVGGYLALHALGLGTVAALVGAAALTATSVGISARVLGELGLLETPDGQVVLGAAVLDDVVGLIILSVIAGLTAGDAPSTLHVAKVAGVAIGFVAAALLVGSRAVPPVLARLAAIEGANVVALIGLGIAFLLAWLADRAGSAMIIGAFAAGVVVHPTPEREAIERDAHVLGALFVPVFFASVGAAVDLHALLDPRSLLVGGALVVVGIAGKVAAGYAPWWHQGNKLLVGVAMVPRGEVGLIFAQMGLAASAIDAGEFGAIMLMVLVTTFVTPPVLALLARRASPPHADAQAEIR